MKKFMSMLMLVVLTITLSACGNKKPGYQAYESLTFSQEHNANLASQYLIVGRDIKAGKISITCNEATGKNGAEDGVCKFYSMMPEVFVENGSANVVGNDGELHFQSELNSIGLSSSIEEPLNYKNKELYTISVKQGETFQINDVINGKTIFIIEPSSQNEKINYTVSSDGSGSTDGEWVYENKAESNSFVQEQPGSKELYPARALVGKDIKPGKVKLTCQESDSGSCLVGLVIGSDAGTQRTYNMGSTLGVGESIDFDLEVVPGDQLVNQPKISKDQLKDINKFPKKQTVLIETVEE